MELERTTRPVAPGAKLTSFSRLEPDKWLRADALSFTLGSGSRGTRADYLSSGKVAERKPLSELVKQHDPGKGRRTVAALNGDFFDINQTGAPLGPGLRNGRATHSPASGASEAVGIGPRAAGRILDLYFEGTLDLPGGKRKLEGYNAADVPLNGVAAYTSQWGEADRAQTVDESERTTEVTVEDGAVTSVAEKPGKGAIPDGVTVLLGRDLGADALAKLRTGDKVSWEYHVRTDDGSPAPRTAVGGRGVLVRDGEPQDWDGRPNNATAPRTAVGFSRDGGTMHVLSVDGRQAASGGVTLTELAKMMRKLGAYNALNLDGGGSSTLLAREPGAREPQLENSPSDGEEREVPNGLALTAPQGSGRLKGFWVQTATDRDRAPTADNIPGGHPERVFPGLTRKLTAAGYDETYGPAAGQPHWRTSRPGVGRVGGDGTFRARRTGGTEVVARRGAARGSTKVQVVGALERIAPTAERVGLTDSGDTGTFGLLGYDADGTSAPIEPADVRLEYDRARFTVTPDPDAGTGAFQVRARPGNDSGSATVTATVRGRTAKLAVTVGLRDETSADFEDASAWRFTSARADGELAADPGGHTGTGLRMSYDFTQSTATRAAYANPPVAIPVPGQPKSFTLWLKGDGHGAWPSLHLKDAVGTDHVLRGPLVEWEGWRKLTFEVPEGVAYPLRVQRFYLAETRPAAQYRGEVVLDQLTARIPPDVDLPAAERPHDPVVSTAASAAGRDWRFAVVSDAQFVARDPDSDIVRQARRTLREIRAAGPDFVIVNGDLVDEGAPEDLKFARKVLEEELGDAVPWYYVPGNHEVMGGSLDDFVREFGPPRRTFDHKGTRFITLDTSSLTLRGGGYAQFQELRRQLDAAARNRRIGSVVVVQHVPPRDPTPQHASQLTDRMEADLLEDWLGGFRARTGKGAALIGAHAGIFDATRIDGVPYLINGNSGKAPASPPDEGGFTGWSLLGVDRGRPSRHGGWLSAQIRAHVDALSLAAPGEVRVGKRAKARATVRQAGRDIPVSWPMSADWPASRGLCVKNTVPRGRCVAAFDPETGALTGRRPGRVTLRVEVNGVPAERVVRITR
ncbi:phosphodiester glycosidase family protein [Streptomyces boncukensis]|nr:phosphodiester glycosidase family protein [Streptomyces boncukensis]